MAEANWYVVHTYSGYENKVKVDIEKTIENRKLQDEILEVRVPLEDVVEMRNGVKKQVSRKMFPGYVLIHMIMKTTHGMWFVTQEVLQDSWTWIKTSTADSCRDETIRNPDWRRTARNTSKRED